MTAALLLPLIWLHHVLLPTGEGWHARQADGDAHDRCWVAACLIGTTVFLFGAKGQFQKKLREEDYAFLKSAAGI